MQIVINGEPREIADDATIALLLVSLDLQPRFVAVKCNEMLVPRTRHANHKLNPGDRVEIVTLVGGG